jgi:hypothetical protein
MVVEKIIGSSAANELPSNHPQERRTIFQHMLCRAAWERAVNALLYTCELQMHAGTYLTVVHVVHIVQSLRSSQVVAIHPLYLHSAMSDTSLPTSSCSRRASAPTSQESWTACEEAAPLHIVTQELICPRLIDPAEALTTLPYG